MNSAEQLHVALVSLGCPKNLVDSEKIAAHLAEAGCVVGAPMDDADVIVVNTCAFLSSAKDESLEVIGEAMAQKQAGRARRVVVAGCLVNRDGDALLAESPGIDAVVGIYDRPSIVQAVLGEGQLSQISPNDRPVAGDRGRLRLTLPHTAYLRISEGCSHRCTFCTIPDIRGPFRSKPLDEIVAEARELVDSGAIELNLIGQDTTGYGSDLAGGPGLADVLGALDGVDGVEWLRLMYAYPTGLTDDVLAAMAGSDHVVPYIDVPLQHISDPILKRMGRRMGRADVEAMLDRVRDRLGSPAIRTTFIVGFPGETEAQFEELLDFMVEFGFDAAGVFAYSPEGGTPAAKLDGAVAEEVKAERVERLMLAQQDVAFEANAASVGQSIDVLVDAADNGGPPVGRHAGQAPEIDSVCLLAEPREPGRIILAEVVDWQDYDLVVQPSEPTL